ncbi:uncharacterized protein MKK02DRAFT_24769 [Dioszegia hungarica]|uniref:RPA43 OB domain-containing protein n=1 Tax=Dioszegia hungarica TaxID=4972 RepID=A0AA38H8P8_9TREE|nr:uncharacterized protein MKK02DRAFT_24769 [Dioszegia hungarica]KAI9635840.1 hypothetical protein MKK02DRAFT_24769 [Dioszegia hungarica]
MRLSVPPRFSGDYMVGVREQLDGMVMRYVSHVQGVLLAHWDHTFLDQTVNIINECPFGVADIEFEALIWAPKIGQKLYGTHSLSSPSHLSLLFSRTFNVSIPLQHIPQDTYEFEATNQDDEEEEDSDSEDGLIGLGGLNGHGQVEEVGRWKSRSTGELVGQGGKGVKFTVIGMQVTNQMLSLTGSLLADPHNPPSPPPTPAAAQPMRDSPTPEPEYHSQTPVRPAKKPRQNKDKENTNNPIEPSHPIPARASKQPRPVPVLEEKEEIDESFLSARELKQKRKEEAKAKRDARKEKKAENVMVAAQAVGGDMAVGLEGAEDAGAEVGKKRKGGAGEGGQAKKRKE